MEFPAEMLDQRFDFDGYHVSRPVAKRGGDVVALPAPRTKTSVGFL